MPDLTFRREGNLDPQVIQRLVDMGQNTFAEETVSRDPSLARAIPGNTIQRLNNTTAYAAGQLIGGSATGGFDGSGQANANGFTFPGFARSLGGMVQLTSLRMFKSQATALGTTEFLVFRGKPAFTIADAQAITTALPAGVSMGGSAASSPRLIARFALDWREAIVFADGAELAVIPQRGFPAYGSVLPTGVDLFAIHVARGSGYAPLGNETFFPVLEGLAF